MCVCMNAYIAETVRARTNKVGENMFHYVTQIKLILEFSHAPLRPYKSIKVE